MSVAAHALDIAGAAAPRRKPGRPRIGLVLGSGAARGWAHIGVIRTLERAGIRPDIVCGTSVGALVGAAYAADTLERFEEWVLSMRWSDVISFMDVRLSGGLLEGRRLMAHIRRMLEDRPIEELRMPFGAVATTLHTGAEVWLRSGSTLEAVRASFAMPGLFTPVQRDGVVLVDGALVNPVPVSLARSMGADVVIAVDLSSDMLSRHLAVHVEPEASNGYVSGLMRKVNLSGFWPAPDAPRTPSMMSVIASSLDIMLVRITRSRMAGDPPDVTVAPRLAHLGLLDFHRAEEAVQEGERAAAAALDNLRLFGIDTPP
ncbi:MAG TPA: patatin-like phospholipase RssA [Gammaproteobacteria bacterium]